MKNKFYSLIIVCLVLLFSGIGNVHSQNKVKTTTKKAPNKSWLEMIQDPNVNFFDAQNAFYAYWQGRTDYKGNGYKVFKRWEYINKYRVLPNGKLQSPEYIKKEYDKYMMKQTAPNKSANGLWNIVGPTQYFINNTGQPTGMGRINAIAFHPTDANTIYIGSPSGGIWKTTTGGNTWENLANNLPKLGVSSILIHPTNPDIIYIGTGDRDGGDAPGIGIFKSVNGGNSWTQINNTMGNVIVGDMIMHPSDPNTILAATSGGIYKTTNGGNTWSLKSGANNFKDIHFKPGDPTVVYAVRITTPSRFYRSTNTGDSWSQITSGIPTSGIGSRMVIGTSPANANYVYLLQIKSTDGTFANLLRSTDAGISFTSMSTSPNILGYNCDGSGTASQATYDLCITVDRNNPDILFVGGLNTWKSNDGGTTWNISTHWSSTCGGLTTAVHADHHVFEWNPLDGNLYLGHDGGITYTSNGGSSWVEITGGLAISQIYRLGQGANSNNYTVIGLQDNGSAATINGNTFYTTRGGDGTECIIDYNNANYCYNTYVNGSISRSTTGPAGSYSNIGSEGTNGIDESGPWILPYFLSKTDPNIMFAGYKNVWRTVNVRTSSSANVSWSKISTGETDICEVLEQSAADPNIIYVVRYGSMKRTDNANDIAANVVWTTCTLPDGLTPNDLKTHPTNPNIVYAVAQYSVYKSTDKGITWTDMDPNYTLPSLYINTLVYDKNSNEGIYIGNQTGVWYKNAAMTDWELFSNGLPPVDVRELEIFYDPVGTQNKLKAATYGRGLWQSDLKETGVLNPTDFIATVINIDKIDLNWTLTNGNNVVLAYSTSPTFGTPVNGNSYPVASSIPGGGTVVYNGNLSLLNHTGLSPNTTYYYKLWSYDGSSVYSSGTTANANTGNSLADFYQNTSISCNGSLTVNFIDASIGHYNSWAWDVDNNGTTDYTTQNPVHTYSTPGLYSVKLTINNGLAAITKEKMILVMSAAPTTSTGCTLNSNTNSGNNFGIGISRFAIGNIDNTTTGNDGYYQNYACSKWTPLELNTNYNVTITTGTTNNEGAKVFIDYNDNGIFETSEAVVAFPSNKDGLRTLTFTTPSTGVVLNKGLRLRVLSKFSGVPSTGCDIGSYGQAEDYTVYIISNSITTGTFSSQVCQGAAINVPFTINGIYNSGNIFTAQLSDASGSFVSPVTIGTLSGTSAGTISATIPLITAYGTGYKIRVISSNPVITGSIGATSITINTNPAPAITGTLTFCADASTTLDAGAYSGYLWSNNATTQTITVNTAGTFTVTVTNPNGCTAAASPVFTVVNALPTPSITGSLAFCYGNSTTLHAGPYSGYLWSTNATNQTINVSTSGTYSVTVTDGNGCTGVSSPVTTVINMPVTPTFTQLGPYIQGATPGLLPGTSNNGISGTWSPATINTATPGTTVYTFTPGAGECATTKTMSIVVNSPTPVFTYTQDIGTTVLVTWPVITNAVLYHLQYSLTPSGPWIGAGSNINMLKVINLTPGTTYYWRASGYNTAMNQVGTVYAGAPYTTATTNYVKTNDIGTTCQISWNDCDPWSNYYVVYYKTTSSSTWTATGANINYKKLSGLTPETTYDIRVVVYKNLNVWGSLSQGQFTTGKITYAGSNITTTSLDLTWTACNTDVTTWQNYSVLYYKPNTSGTWSSKAIHSNANTAHLTGLTANTTYDCYVAPYISYILWGNAQQGSFATLAAKANGTQETSTTTHLYPNPFTDQINLEISTQVSSTLTWTMYDMTGKQVMSGNESITSGFSTLNIDAGSLSKGIYMLNAIINNEKQSFRIIKE